MPPARAPQPAATEIPTRTTDPLIQFLNERLNRIDGHLDEIDERLRKIETGEPGCRADIQGQINGVGLRVTTLEDIKAGERLLKIEPTVRNINRLAYALAIPVVLSVLGFLWGLLTHTITITLVQAATTTPHP